jgi:hypothetical protein
LTLRFENVLRDAKHLIRQLDLGDVGEIFSLVPHFVRIAQRHAAKSIAERLDDRTLSL